MAAYVVIESTPGYLPEDDDPATFENIDDARSYAAEELERLLDYIAEGWEGFEETETELAAFTVQGSFADTDCFSVLVYDKSREHDLGRIIEIVECEPADCPPIERTS